MDKAFIELEINETLMRSEVEELKRICEMHIKSLYNVNLAKAEERINKAIEYIKERTEYNQYSEVYPSVLDSREVKNILKILRGE